MKDILTYVKEGFFSNVGATDYFNKSFDTIEEFANVCSIVFKDRLDKPIKIKDSEVVWRHAYVSLREESTCVYKHFTMSFNGGKKKLRIGVHNGMLLMQMLYKDYKERTHYTWMTSYLYNKTSKRCGYLLRKGINFKQWVNTRDSDFNYLRKIFMSE